jgi:pimeloyl-ACP methyl ester carboxylesterase
MRNKIIGTLTAVIVLLVAAYLILGYVLYDRLTTVVEGQSINQPNTPADFTVRGGPYVAFDTVPYEMPAYSLVHFPSRDSSVILAGWYIEGNPTAPAVVVTHGFPHCKCDPNVLTPAGMLHRNGFNILMIDLRNHGQSDVVNGHAAFGNTEWQDVLGAWDWPASQKHFAPQRVGLYGVSMGGAATLIAVAQEPRVAAAFTDSAFADLGELIDDELQRMHFPTLLSYSGFFIARVVGGEDLRAHSRARVLSMTQGAHSTLYTARQTSAWTFIMTANWQRSHSRPAPTRPFGRLTAPAMSNRCFTRRPSTSGG